MQEYFSLVPWTGIYLRTDGNAYPCESVAWEGDNDYCVGNIQTHSFEEMWNHEVYRKMRLQVLKTKKCSIDNELTNSCTYLQKRHLYNQDIDYYKLNTKEDGSFLFNLKKIDLERSNICNLACVYCNPVSSSSWAKKLKTEPQKRIPDEIYWERLNPVLPQLEEIAFAGGEPVLDVFNEQILDKLISLNRFINVNMSTNVTYDLQKRISMFQKLEKFQTRIFCSVDSWGKTFETIRENSNWDLVFNNLKQLKTMNFKLLYCITISVLNCFTLKEYHEFLLNNNLADVDSIRYQPVCHPAWLSIRNLSGNKKKQLKYYFLNYIMFLKKLENSKGSDLDIWCNNKPVSEALADLITKYLYTKEGSENYLSELTNKLELEETFLESIKLG